MAFITVPLNITGPSYQSRSRPLASQTTRNFYQEINEGGKDQYTLMSFPGQKLFGSTGLLFGLDRGMHEMAQVLFRVAATKLYRVDEVGNHFELGDIPGNERCIFADDGVNLFIVTELKVYHYDGVAITQVLDPEIDGAKSVAFINNQFLYTKDRFTTVSDVGNGASASGLNIVGAESDPDILVRDYVFQQNVYRMGAKTTEIWYNDGVSTPPIVRIEGQMFQVGLSSIYSVSHTDNFMYWLGDDRQVYQATSGGSRNISSVAISNAIEGYTTIDDASGFTFTLQGQNFYVLTFPTENKTWVVNETLEKNGWFELASGTDGGKYNSTSLVFNYGKNILADELNGNLYELDVNTFDNNSDVQQKVRVTNSINGDLLQSKGRRLQMSRFELIMETGVGLITGQGENPRVQIESSIDGGKSFKHEGWARVGRLGETNLLVEWFSLKTFYDLMIRITVTDPVPIFIYSAAIDLRLAGK